ncbi:MAG: M14 family metallopeptidase [Acidobacteria bacterium]|nr:M14 family metallopeptidase [Acidobacteriota bacterium]MCW5949690.1 M14 family metallopeptidase [Pyrinomonadaceae bacterium]
MFIKLYRSRSLAASAALIFLAISVKAQSDHGTIPAEWQTAAERSAYARTSRYDETIAFAKKLAAASALIEYRSIGRSGEGRDVPLLIAASNRAFSPELARRQGKAVIFIQAGIHAGEIDGKDAGLALLRDVAITRTKFALLDNVVILFVPIYSVDGHENWSPYGRINQNGPEEMGYRANATNLNLNRDFMKADAPETRAWLGLWNTWKPDIFVDCHVTDGADFQYNVTYEFAHFDEIHSAVRDWMVEHFDRKVVPRVEARGNLLTHYVEFAGREVTGGVATFIATPRYATGYTPLRNRAGLLIETHVYKPYRSRVRGTYDVLDELIAEVGRDRASLLSANERADNDTVARGRSYNAERRFPLTLAITDKATQIEFKGVEYKTEESPISGARRIVYGTTPITYKIPKFDDARVSASVAPPAAYMIPPQWKEVISVLELHGVAMRRLTHPAQLDVESYRLTEPKWSAAPFEGRITLACKPLLVKEKREYPTGSVIVPLDQPEANVAIHLLEPAGPDSFVYWGYFNSVFEQKEYGEGYQIEKLAIEMMRSDPALKAEFEEKLKDEYFARNPRARLNFFYERSPYYLRQKIGVYPVGRLLVRPDSF